MTEYRYTGAQVDICVDITVQIALVNAIGRCASRHTCCKSIDALSQSICNTCGQYSSTNALRGFALASRIARRKSLVDSNGWGAGVISCFELRYNLVYSGNCMTTVASQKKERSKYIAHQF